MPRTSCCVFRFFIHAHSLAQIKALEKSAAAGRRHLLAQHDKWQEVHVAEEKVRSAELLVLYLCSTPELDQRSTTWCGRQ